MAADLDHAVEVGAKVRPETGAALFEAWSGGHDAGLVPSVVNVPVLIIGGADDPFVTRELLTTANDLSSFPAREQRGHFECGSLATS